MKSLSIVLVTLIACAGPQGETTGTPTTGTPTTGTPTTGTPAAASGDVTFEVPVVTIKSAPVEPNALNRPGMPQTDPKRKTTLDKQRAVVKAAKDPLTKQVAVAVLATLLYQDARANRGNEKDLFAEARQALRDAAQAIPEKDLDELTLAQLAYFEVAGEDFAAAEKAFAGVIQRDPKSKEMTSLHTWLAYSQLKQFKNAEALATVAADKLEEKQAELAYVIAWAKLRNGDAAGAWEAMLVAFKGWGQNPKLEEIIRDLIYIAGRATLPTDQVISTLTTTIAKTKQQQYELVAKLGNQGYAGEGRWADAIDAIDKSFTIAGDTMSPFFRVRLRGVQSECAVRMAAPDVAVRYAKLSIEAIAPCGKDCSDQENLETIHGIHQMGQLFHVLFATANDKTYYQPAHDLYALTMPLLPAAEQPRAQKDSKLLEDTKKNIKAGTGTHDKGAFAALLGWHDTEVLSCYEHGLGASPKASGTITVQLESDATGVVKGVATDPKAGAADLAAVAGCVADRVKAWKLPSRGMPGTTRIKLSYALKR